MARYSNAFIQYLSGNGDALPGSKLDFFSPGTTTPKNTFSDSGLTTVNPNPVVADSDGRMPDIFLDGTYKVVLKTAADVTVDTADPVGETTAGELQAWLTDVTYNIPDLVKGSDNRFYRSLTNSNQGNDPTSSAANWEQIDFTRIWNLNVTYAAGNEVFGSDGAKYSSKKSSNLNNDPTKDDTSNWTTIRSGVNLIINGDSVIDQRAVSTAINDDTYAWDRWVILSDGNGVVTPSQESSDLPFGARSAGKLTVAIANKKFGILQIVEGKNSKSIISSIASLSASAKSSGISNMRVAILSWDSTEDSVTSDVVSAWNAAGTDPTLVANWTYENVPANIGLSASWNSGFDALNVSIDTASTKQVAVFMWVDDTDASVSDTLLVTNVKLEQGPQATDFEFESVDEVFEGSRRYAINNSAVSHGGEALAGNGFNFNIPLGKEMRIAPAVTPAMTFTTVNCTASISSTTTQGLNLNIVVTANGPWTAVSNNVTISDSEL